ncbi:MAG TPA: hypothetical protein VFP84_34290 [Kofleriaceae bacterium]|nr:hypothetical protein [Kofleriaceae bacterium]
MSAMRGRAGWLCVVVAIAACGHDKPVDAPRVEPLPTTPGDKLLAMLPQGAQVVVEIDLARLRANPVIGAVVTDALAARSVSLPDGVPAPPLAGAAQLVLAAYGVGTAQAATLTLLAAPQDVPGTTKISDGFFALGPPAWVEQVQNRVSLASTGETKFAIRAPGELLALREHAVPPGAPGASLRVTAMLPFDARVALARQTGLDSAPAQISAWADVADDLALIVDCDASDPGNRAAPGKKSDAPRRLEAMLRGALAAVADQPAVRALGLPSSLGNAKIITRGTWVRAIVAIGPAHLKRVVERAAKLLHAPGNDEQAPVPPSTGDPAS